MIDFILVLAVVYVGLICGILLSAISPEELKTGRNWFFFLKKLILSASVLLLIGLLNFPFSWVIGVVISLVLVKVKLSNGLTYLLIPFLMYVHHETYLVLFGSLYFLMGIAIGSEYLCDFVDKNNDRKLTEGRFVIIKDLVRKTSLYFVSSLVVIVLSFLI